MPAITTIPAEAGTLARAASDPREPALAAAFARLAGGDLDALEAIYDAWSRDLYALALWRTGSAADAADALQDVFLRLATTRAALRAVSRPRRYLLRMARRAAVDRLRKRRDDAPVDEAALLESAALDPGRAADAARVSRALATLPAAQREVVLLHLVQDLPFREAARVAGVPTFTAASRYRLAIARLRRALGIAR